LNITNNIVAGVVWTGYTAMTHDCGDTTSRFFYNNVAHGVRYKNKGGYGVLYKHDRDSNYQDTNGCVEASYFTAYKCSMLGAAGPYAGKTKKTLYTNMIMIDNVLGVGPTL